MRQAAIQALTLACALTPWSLAASEAERSTAPPAFWLEVLTPGVHRLTFDELESEAPLPEVDSNLLRLTQRGEPVRIWVDDGGDGRFGRGDAIEFVGRHLEGEVSHFHLYSPVNVYRLSVEPQPAGSESRYRSPEEGPGGTVAAPLLARRHFENDRLMVRFREKRGTPPRETWFWERLTFLAGRTFRTEVELDGLLSGGGRTARARFDLRGWSRTQRGARGDQIEHHVDVAFNGVQVGPAQWDGRDPHSVTFEPLPPGALADTTQVSLSVPQRPGPNGTDPLVDLSLLNWFEIEYPHDGSVVRDQTVVHVAGSGRRSAVFEAPGADTLTAFSDSGERWFASAADGATRVEVTIEEDRETEVVAVRSGGHLEVHAVRVDRPSDWRSGRHSADYLMIAHESLLEGTRRLARFHRDRGLEVAVVDVQDLYDEFSHGVVEPRAIRDFIDHAYHRWQGGPPRFVLLVGDASWDIDGRSLEDSDYADWSFLEIEAQREGFLKNLSTPYDGAPRMRGLIPTGSYRSAEGHAASDNYFVALGEEDNLPRLAIGRIPVVDPADLDAVVDKTIRYVRDSQVGPWRRRILWISNEEATIRNRNDELAADRNTAGFSGLKIYPRPEERSNDEHQQALLEALDDGQLVVYFHGHGGRYIWRTGATDHRKNRDLFNLDHLDQLAPNERLPVILSMTCYSAPFDHPLADSIGEKFLRLPESGAIAVFAASWRNSPALDLSQALVEELTKPQTIGEAIVAAKSRTVRKDMIETYNLLGDPAVPVAAPRHRLEITAHPIDEGYVVRSRLPATIDGFSGSAIVDAFDAEGRVVASREVRLDEPRLETTLDGIEGTPVRIGVYLWDPDRGLDAIGATDLAPGDTVQGSP